MTHSTTFGPTRESTPIICVRTVACDLWSVSPNNTGARSHQTKTVDTLRALFDNAR